MHYYCILFIQRKTCRVVYKFKIVHNTTCKTIIIHVILILINRKETRTMKKALLIALISFIFISSTCSYSMGKLFKLPTTFISSGEDEDGPTPNNDIIASHSFGELS